MHNQEESIGPVLVMRFERPIDRENAATIDDWARRRLASGERFLVLHCGKVPYFDSNGLETVLGVTRDAASRGARFALVGLNQDCKTTLRVTRLERAVEHYMTVEDAIRVLRGAMS